MVLQMKKSLERLLAPHFQKKKPSNKQIPTIINHSLHSSIKLDNFVLEPEEQVENRNLK